MVRTKKIALLIVLSFACAPAFPQTASDQTAAVTSALRARDFDKAVELSQSALQKSPNDPRLWTLQGMALANQGDTKKALVAFERALKISPNYVAALEGA